MQPDAYPWGSDGYFKRGDRFTSVALHSQNYSLLSRESSLRPLDLRWHFQNKEQQQRKVARNPKPVFTGCCRFPNDPPIKLRNPNLAGAQRNIGEIADDWNQRDQHNA